MLRTRFPLRTERLTLRPYTPGDLDDLHAIQSLPEVARYLYWEARSLDEVRRVLTDKCRQVDLAKEGDRLSLAVYWPEAGKVVGEVSLVWLSEIHRQGEIGFVFHPHYHGKGLAREASEALLDIGFSDLGLHRVIGRCDARNGASARLLQRLGMRQEAHFLENEIFKGAFGDELVYAMLESEWQSRQDDTAAQPS